MRRAEVSELSGLAGWRLLVERIRIYKYHGLGNDFVIVDRGQLSAAGGTPPGRWARAICDRRRGVGADGLLVVTGGGCSADFDGRMTIYNADGSRPEMCGNGIRCVARHLTGVEGDQADSLTIQTDGGPRTCHVTARSAGPWDVAVDMGAPVAADEPIAIDIGEFVADVWPVDLGNPHAVIFQKASRETLDEVGAALNDDHPNFPDGVNVECVEPIGPQTLRVRVYERGVGRTRACGTGACAAAVGAVKTGRCSPTPPIEVELPGGRLQIALRDDVVWMSGPAAFVFDGWLSWVGTDPNHHPSSRIPDEVRDV